MLCFWWCWSLNSGSCLLGRHCIHLNHSTSLVKNRGRDDTTKVSPNVELNDSLSKCLHSLSWFLKIPTLFMFLKV
jgi:hypothetical protein